jgi:hypothetical protein
VVNRAQRFERRLERVVGAAFARVFKGQVEPVEIGAALEREATDQKAVMGEGRVMAPNRYRVTLGASDYDRLQPWEEQLVIAFAELVQEHLDDNGWTTLGDIEVYLARDDSLHTGVFGVASRMESNVAPRQRPHDSLSLPQYLDQQAAQHPAGQHGAPLQAVPLHPAPPSYAPQVPAPAPEALYNAPHPPYDPYQPSGAGGLIPGFDGQYAQPNGGYPAHPVQPVRYRYVLHLDGTPQMHVLHTGSNVVGRGNDADLRLNDQGVSRRHLDVQFDGFTATAYDLGSTNGTTINGHPMTAQQLQHGDVLRIGHSRLVFQQEPA